VHNDQPTIPNLHYYEPGDPSLPTVPGDMPPWPLVDERAQPPFRANRPFRGDARTLLLGVSLGANAVLLVGLLGVLLLSHAGFFSPTGSPPAVSTRSTSLGSPTATSSATSSATVLTSGGWLQMVPGSVQLACAGSQQSQFVVLQNTGPQTVQWQVDLSGLADPASVGVSPDHGELAAGASTSLQIQYQAHHNDQQGSSGQQGVIHFVPDIPDAGAAPSLSITTVGCN
jgi:hypothetical protein